jgi:enoyl-CoA hydratase/carnithine racemase
VITRTREIAEPAQTEPPLLVEDHGAVRWIWFNRPAVHNAQNVAMLELLDSTLAETLVRVEAGTTRVAILAGKGKSFCSGHDLKQILSNETYRARAATTEGRWRQEARLFLGPVERWRSLPIPTVCRVQGYCLAAGLMFVDASDLVIATTDAVFGSPIIRSQAVNDAEILTLAWRLGERRAKQLLWLGERFGSALALEWGFVNWIAEPDDIDSRLEELAAKLAEVPVEALELSKASFLFLSDRQGWRDSTAFHFMAHQLSHQTTAAKELLDSRIKDLGREPET